MYYCRILAIFRVISGQDVMARFSQHLGQLYIVSDNAKPSARVGRKATGLGDTEPEIPDSRVAEEIDRVMSSRAFVRIRRVRLCRCRGD